MQSLANELAPDMIRVNSVHPSAVDNDMIHNQALYHLLLPDRHGDITRQEIEPVFQTLNALPIPWVESVDISNAALFLASDEGPATSPASPSPSTPARPSNHAPPSTNTPEGAATMPTGKPRPRRRLELRDRHRAVHQARSVEY
jgi:hypothetical protein